MKWFFSGLLVANLAMLAWNWQLAGQDMHSEAMSMAEKAHAGPKLMLLAELDAPLPARREAAAVPRPAPRATPVVVEEADVPAPAAEVPQAAACLRLVAFESETMVARAARVLQQGGATILRQGEDAGASQRYWVMLPPVATPAAATPVLERLRRAGIKDFYLIRGGENLNAISLGVYSRKDAAQRRVQQIRDLKLVPRIEEISLPAKRWWLEFEWPDAEDGAAWQALLPRDMRDVSTQSCR